MSTDYPTCRERWTAGLCPCCGGALDVDGLNGEKAATLGEAVQVCGWCVYRHGPMNDIHEAILQAVATGIDPVTRPTDPYG